MRQIITSPITLTSIKPSFPPLIFHTHIIKSKTHIKNTIISAKWGKKRSGSQRSRKIIINSIAQIASTFKILPEPFDTLVKELCFIGGGNGGKFGFKNVLGGGGGGGGRSQRRDKIGFWVVLLVSSSLALWVAMERQRESDLVLWVFLGFCVCAFVVCCLVKGSKKEVKDWILGFFCGAAIMGLGLRNNVNFVRWVDEIKCNALSFMVLKKRRRRKRWI